MKKLTPLYIPLLVLFLFAVSVLISHFSRMTELFASVASDYVMPFTIDGYVTTVRPEAEKAGLRVKDRIVAINGRTLENNDDYREEIVKMQNGLPINLTVRRQTETGQTETQEITVSPFKVEKDINFYSRLVVGFLVAYLLPTLCIVLGFGVVFMRPRDFLAWLLLLLLLGVSSTGLEGYPPGTLVNTYTQIFFSMWALSMLLFGIYFPERWSVDQRFPWAKWIFIVPLSLQCIFVVLNFLKFYTGIGLVDYLMPLKGVYSVIIMPLNLLSIGIFFAALAHKSGTIKNLDSRRRLKLMVVGTSLAMSPSFIIIIYRIVSGATGSFFDLVPFWVALFALLMMPLFPLTLAYVIVVQRAMDVGVVIRQGLQYALARNGIKILQFFLFLAIGLATLWTINNYGRNISTQIAFIVGGIALIPLIDLVAKNLRVWIDRKFFRDAYSAEQILSDLSEDVRTMVETKPLLETVSAKISESLHVPQVALLLKKGNNFQPVYTLGYDVAPTIEFSEGDKTVEKLKKNESLTIYQDDEESWVNEEIQAGERVKLQTLNSQLLLPIGAKNGLSGVISLGPKRSEEPYSPNDLRLLKSVAAQTGLALENSRLTEAIAYESGQKERLNRELEIAREVQERLFPQELPPTEGLDYIGACRPALGVGGDYYDFLELPEGAFGIAIGDVSGKGIGASLMMASLQASLRGQAIHCGSDLAALMRHVNTLVYEASTSNRYATFFYAQLNVKSRKLIYVNAGHNPPFVIRKSGEVLRLEEGGAVVGMLPTMFINYTQGEMQLEEGDLFVGYTDGISEAMNPAEEEWSEDAMLEELKIVYDKPSEEILTHIVACADKFASGAKQHDDMTMIIVKII